MESVAALGPHQKGLVLGPPRGAVLHNPLCTGKWKIQAPLTTWHLHSGTQAQTPISLELSMITSCKSVFWPALSSFPVNMPYVHRSSLSHLPRGDLLGREPLLLIRAHRRKHIGNSTWAPQGELSGLEKTLDSHTRIITELGCRCQDPKFALTSSIFFSLEPWIPNFAKGKVPHSSRGMSWPVLTFLFVFVLQTYIPLFNFASDRVHGFIF